MDACAGGSTDGTDGSSVPSVGFSGGSARATGSPLPATPIESPESAPVLKADGLSKRYGAVTAVDGITFEVPAGRIVGLVGNNGAGKTTTLKMLCGVLEPSAGTATVDGRTPLHAEARRSLGFLPEDSPLYDDQTPLQYLAFFARLYGLPRRDAAAPARPFLP